MGIHMISAVLFCWTLRKNLPLHGYTRRYPWGIQRIDSTHQLQHKSFGKGDSGATQIPSPDQIFIRRGVLQTNSNAKCQVLTNFSFFWGGGQGSKGVGVTPDQLKLKVPSPGQVFIWSGTPDQLKSKVPQSGQIFIFGGGHSRPTQIQSPPILSNFHFQGVGGTPHELKSKSQVLAKFSFSKRGVFQTNSNPKYQVQTKFSLRGTPNQLKSKVPSPGQVFMVGEYSRLPQIQSPSMWPNFYFQRVQTNSNPKSLNLAKFPFLQG